MTKGGADLKAELTGADHLAPKVLDRGVVRPDDELAITGYRAKNSAIHLGH